MKNNFISLTAVVCLLLSCNKPETIPSYLSIQKIDVQGIPDHKIAQAWVYANNNFLGAYSLPAEIPVLETGNVVFQIFPGILENGDFRTPNIYPILEKSTLSATMIAGQTTAVSPILTYKTTSVESFFEDFEPNSQRTLVENRDNDPATKLELATSDVFAGARSAKIYLDTAHQTFEIWTLPLTDLPINSRPVWLEFSYKTDFEFRVGLAGAAFVGGTENVTFFQSVFPKTTWTKMYMNLTEVLATSKFPQYKVAFRATLPLDAAGKPTILNGSMWLDNLRLVYLK
jgi:hypothetical protein